MRTGSHRRHLPLLAVLLAAPVGCSAPARPPEPATLAVPSAEARQPPAAPIQAAPEPVYRNPRIAVVYLRAHQDEQGRLLGPQLMYQVTEPGGWNVDAIDQGRAYIPSVNSEAPAIREAPDPGSTVSGCVITGLMKPADRDRAEVMARHAGGTAYFDDQAGWVILQGKSSESSK